MTLGGVILIALVSRRFERRRPHLSSPDTEECAHSLASEAQNGQHRVRLIPVPAVHSTTQAQVRRATLRQLLTVPRCESELPDDQGYPPETALASSSVWLRHRQAIRRKFFPMQFALQRKHQQPDMRLHLMLREPRVPMCDDVRVR